MVMMLYIVNVMYYFFTAQRGTSTYTYLIDCKLIWWHVVHSCKEEKIEEKKITKFSHASAINVKKKKK